MNDNENTIYHNINDIDIIVTTVIVAEEVVHIEIGMTNMIIWTLIMIKQER